MTVDLSSRAGSRGRRDGREKTDGRTRRVGVRAQAYIHAKHMYDVGATKNRKLVFGLATFSVVFLGTAIPIYAINVREATRPRTSESETRARTRD